MLNLVYQESAKFLSVSCVIACHWVVTNRCFMTVIWLMFYLFKTFSRFRHILSRQHYVGEVQIVTVEFSFDLGNGLCNGTP